MEIVVKQYLAIKKDEFHVYFFTNLFTKNRHTTLTSVSKLHFLLPGGISPLVFTLCTLKGWVGKKSEVKGYSHTQVSINATPVYGLPGFLREEWRGRGGAGQRRQPEKKLRAKKEKKRGRKGIGWKRGEVPRAEQKMKNSQRPLCWWWAGGRQAGRRSRC